MTRFRDELPRGARVFESRLQVQWADVDVAGVMYFAAYSRFAEYAEMQLFADLGFPYDAVFAEYGFWLPRVRVEAEYYAPALMSDWLKMRTHVRRVGNSSVHWQTVVFNERTGTAGAALTFIAAAMDGATKKSRPLPEPVRRALLACLGETPA
jgi:YbgC/YbaW family acyl-CoA thioester hydrolase